MDDELFMGTNPGAGGSGGDGGQGSGALSMADMVAKQQSPKQSLADTIVPLRVEDVFSEHFSQVMKQNESQIKLNIFLIGYQCDQGVRVCGGRSGTDLGPDNFREMLQGNQEKNLVEVAAKLKEQSMTVYDLGNITKY